jgi:hypothetical protein
MDFSRNMADAQQEEHRNNPKRAGKQHHSPIQASRLEELDNWSYTYEKFIVSLFLLN